MSNNFKKLFTQISHRILFVLAYQVTTLISIPILANNLSQIEFGKIMICTLLVQLSWIVSEWGIPNFTIELLRNNNSKRNKSLILSAVIKLNLMFIIFFLLIFFLLINFFFPDLSLVYYYALIPSMIFGILNPSWFFILINKIKDLLLITFISRLLFLLCVMFLVTSDRDAIFYLIIQGISFGLISIYGFYKIYKENFFIDFSFFIKKLNFKFKLFKKSYIYFMTHMVDNNFPILWALSASYIGGPYIASIYSIPDQILRATIAFSILISQSIRLNSNKFDERLSTIVLLFCIFGVFFAIVGYTYIESFLNLIFNDTYKESIYFSEQIVLICLLHYLIRMINYPLVGHLYDVKLVNRISIIIFYINISLLIYWMINFTDIQSLVLLMSLSLLAHLIVLSTLIFIKKLKKN
jgi:O-antigen/teichoic acid export membrane protein